MCMNTDTQTSVMDMDMNNWYTCFCAKKYNWSLSILDIDECTEYNETLCSNNGTCENINGSYVCECSFTGYKGVTCETGKQYSLSTRYI